MLRPQTIQIFLPAADPRGMRMAEITTRIVRVIEVPRSQLVEFIKTPEAQQVGVYFLMGDITEDGFWVYKGYRDAAERLLGGPLEEPVGMSEDEY